MSNLLDKVKYVVVKKPMFRSDPNSLFFLIEQSPRKRTIFTTKPILKWFNLLSHKPRYYLAFPYVMYIIKLSIYKKQIYISLRIGMSKTPYESGDVLNFIPLPNIHGTGICLGVSSKGTRISNNISDVIDSLGKDIDNHIERFWNTRFVIGFGKSGHYPSYNKILRKWEKRSKKDDMAAFKFKQRFPSHSTDGYYIKFTDLRPPEDLPEILEKAIMGKGRLRC